MVVDALASMSMDRLGATVQISNAGIAPGSGVGGKRLAINEETMGVPVLAMGVPTVVHGWVLAREVLDKFQRELRNRKNGNPLSDQMKEKFLQELLTPFGAMLFLLRKG